jgi:predicted alpha/beta hydrolase
VAIAATDGTKLSATYYAAAKPGPAVLLLHMCNTTRRSWDPLAPRLAAAGINALSVDYRGFGDSGGARVLSALGIRVPDFVAQLPGLAPELKLLQHAQAGKPQVYSYCFCALH